MIPVNHNTHTFELGHTLKGALMRLGACAFALSVAIWAPFQWLQHIGSTVVCFTLLVMMTNCVDEKKL